MFETNVHIFVLFFFNCSSISWSRYWHSSISNWFRSALNCSRQTKTCSRHCMSSSGLYCWTLFFTSFRFMFLHLCLFFTLIIIAVFDIGGSIFCLTILKPWSDLEDHYWIIVDYFLKLLICMIMIIYKFFLHISHLVEDLIEFVTHSEHPFPYR